MSITLEDLDTVLENVSSTISEFKFSKHSENSEILQRVRCCELKDLAKFTITWCCNVSFLQFANLTVPFDSMKLSNTFPNGAKYNLQFYREGDTYPIAVIKLKQWGA